MKRINRARIAAVRVFYEEISEDVQALYVYKKLTKLAAGTDDLGGDIPNFSVWHPLEDMTAEDLLININALVGDILRMFPKKEKPTVVSETARIVEMVGQRAALCEDSKLTLPRLMVKYGGPNGAHTVFTPDQWKDGVHNYGVRHSYWGWVFRQLKGKTNEQA